MRRAAASEGWISRCGSFSAFTKVGRLAKLELRKLCAGGEMMASGYFFASAGAVCADSRGGMYVGNGSTPCFARVSLKNSHLPEGVGKLPSAKGAKFSGKLKRIQPRSFNSSNSMPRMRG